MRTLSLMGAVEVDLEGVGLQAAYKEEAVVRVRGPKRQGSSGKGRDEPGDFSRAEITV